MTDRVMPRPDRDERSTLGGWLDFYRATLIGKCDGLDVRQLRTASAPPSPLTLLGLVQHAAEVERNWFRRVLTGEDARPIYDPDAPTEGDDGGFDLHDDVTFDDAHAIWRREVDVARANCAGRPLGATSPLIAEYARHIGHADLIRERLDGGTGF